jgi:hypothetical protein
MVNNFTFDETREMLLKRFQLKKNDLRRGLVLGDFDGRLS